MTKKKSKRTAVDSQDLTTRGTPRLRKSKATAQAERTAEFDRILPRHMMSDEFWILHFRHACEHWVQGSTMSFEIAAGSPDDPIAYHLISRAKRVDGGEEERHLHSYTTDGLSFTRRIKAPGETEFTDVTTILPHSKKALRHHLDTMHRCDDRCADPCPGHPLPSNGDLGLDYILVNGIMTVGRRVVGTG
jgi:hypothetical protein